MTFPWSSCSPFRNMALRSRVSNRPNPVDKRHLRLQWQRVDVKGERSSGGRFQGENPRALQSLSSEKSYSPSMLTCAHDMGE